MAKTHVQKINPRHFHTLKLKNAKHKKKTKDGTRMEQKGEESFKRIFLN